MLFQTFYYDFRLLLCLNWLENESFTVQIFIFQANANSLNLLHALSYKIFIPFNAFESNPMKWSRLATAILL